MVILEVLTGQLPFPRDHPLIVVSKVVGGERPERPQGVEAVWFTDGLWKMLEQCWSPQPKLRPAAEAILEHLERASMGWQPLPPMVDDDFQADSDGNSVQTEMTSGNDGGCVVS